MAEYTTLEQVKIRLKQFHIETVTNEDNTTSAEVVVFDKPQDNPLIEQLIKQANRILWLCGIIQAHIRKRESKLTLKTMKQLS